MQTGLLSHWPFLLHPSLLIQRGQKRSHTTVQKDQGMQVLVVKSFPRWGRGLLRVHSNRKEKNDIKIIQI